MTNKNNSKYAFIGNIVSDDDDADTDYFTTSEIKTQMPNKLAIREMFRCTCSGHAVGVSAYRDESEIHIDWWCKHSGNKSIWSRLKKAWEFFREGEFLVNDVYLTLQDADAMVNSMIDAINVAQPYKTNIDRLEQEEVYSISLKYAEMRAHSKANAR